MSWQGPAPDERLLELQRFFTDALLRGSERDAVEALREAVESRYAEAEIDELVVTPALRVIGDLWAEGSLTIGQERVATEIALRVVALQRELFRVQRGRGHHLVVLAAVQGEQHVVGLRMAQSLLVHAGYEVRMLGADVPAHVLLDAAQRSAAEVVGLTLTMAAGVPRLDEVIGALQLGVPGTGIVVGGQGVPRRRFQPPGLAVCETVLEATGAVDALVQGAARN